MTPEVKKSCDDLLYELVGKYPKYLKDTKTEDTPTNKAAYLRASLRYVDDTLDDLEAEAYLAAHINLMILCLIQNHSEDSAGHILEIHKNLTEYIEAYLVS